MDYIVREFIPDTSISNGKMLFFIMIIESFLRLLVDEDHIYGQLFPEALKLCRILASHGSALASNLIHRYELQNRLRNHLVATVKWRQSESSSQYPLISVFRFQPLFVAAQQPYTRWTASSLACPNLARTSGQWTRVKWRMQRMSDRSLSCWIVRWFRRSFFHSVACAFNKCRTSSLVKS